MIIIRISITFYHTCSCIIWFSQQDLSSLQRKQHATQSFRLFPIFFLFFIIKFRNNSSSHIFWKPIQKRKTSHKKYLSKNIFLKLAKMHVLRYVGHKLFITWNIPTNFSQTLFVNNQYFRKWNWIENWRVQKAGTRKRKSRLKKNAQFRSTKP